MEQVGARRDGCANEAAPIARGLLLALAAPSVALAGQDGGALRVLAEIATLPAFIGVAGWLMAEPVAATAPGRFLRAIAPAALCGAAGAVVAGAAGHLAGHDWRHGLTQAAPVWTLPLLTAAYALAARSLRRSAVACVTTAVTAHIAGAILDRPALSYFIFFVAGLGLATRREALLRIVDEEREFAFASGPLAATVAAAVAIRFAQTGHPPSIAAVGPIALVLGLAAGAATLTTATALRASQIGRTFAGLGRAAPALAILWAPLFAALMEFASRGLAPSAASALLMAAASLLFIAVLVDVCREAAEKSRFGRLFAAT